MPFGELTDLNIFDAFQFIAVSLLLKLELSHRELQGSLFMGLAPEPFGRVLVPQVPLSLPCSLVRRDGPGSSCTFPVPDKCWFRSARNLYFETALWE